MVTFWISQLAKIAQQPITQRAVRSVVDRTLSARDAWVIITYLKANAGCALMRQRDAKNVLMGLVSNA